MPPDNPHISSESGRGAIVSHTYVERDVRTYAIFESEVSHISTFNTLATIGFSVGSALLAYAVGIWTNWAFADKKAVPPEGAIMSGIVAWGFVFVAAVFYGIAIWSMVKRGSTWGAIKEQSKSASNPPTL